MLRATVCAARGLTSVDGQRKVPVPSKTTTLFTGGSVNAVPGQTVETPSRSNPTPQQNWDPPVSVTRSASDAAAEAKHAA